MRHQVPASGSLESTLASLLTQASRRTRKQMLAAGRVLVNGVVIRRATTRLAAGDVVEIGARGTRPDLPTGLALVYEDAQMIVVDKPAGLLTIATTKERERTVYAHLMSYTRARRPPARVFIVHRLDREASGLVAFACSPVAKQALQAQFAEHTVDRTYLAIVEGCPEATAGTIRSRLIEEGPGRVRETRDAQQGRAAVTHWRIRDRGVRHTLLEVQIDTGRRNQIRVQLAGVGHPIAGDHLYGAKTDPLRRLGLHAHVLGIDHPQTGERLRFVSPPPASFRSRLD